MPTPYDAPYKVAQRSIPRTQGPAPSKFNQDKADRRASGLSPRQWGRKKTAARRAAKRAGRENPIGYQGSVA